ncbi:MAG: CIA30 family protein [Pseudomonadota bacterium]
MTASAESHTCTLVADLAAEDEPSAWQTVNDGVMGGRSSGGPSFEGGAMEFAGVINTNGGGFSSVRRAMEPGTLAGAEGVMVRMKGDGRAYRLTIRTAERFRGRTVAYTADLDGGAGGDWVETYVPFDAFSASVFGRDVPAAPLDPATAWSVGFILGDGKDGPFSMQAEWIKACMAEAPAT